MPYYFHSTSFKVMMIAGTGVKMLQQTKRCQDGSEEIHGAVVTSFDVGHPAEMADVESGWELPGFPTSHPS